MRRFAVNYKLVALAIAGGAALSQPLVAAPVVQADKGDIACLVALEKMREKVTQDNFTDPRKQVAIQNMAQMNAFYAGKLAGRHPGETATAIAKRMDLKTPEMYKLFDLARCANEFKAALPRPTP